MGKKYPAVTISVSFELPYGMTDHAAAVFVRDAIVARESTGSYPERDVDMDTLSVRVSAFQDPGRASFANVQVETVPREQVALEDVSFSLKMRNGQVALLDVQGDERDEFELRLGHYEPGGAVVRVDEREVLALALGLLAAVEE